MTTGFVLLPGAGLGSWIWRDVQPLLNAPSLAIDYRREGGPADYAQDVQEKVAAWDEADRIVLVCHSLGGVIGLSTAPLLGNRLAGIVGVGAIFPAGGGSFVSAAPIPQRYLLGLIMRIAGTRPPESGIRKGYGSDLPSEAIDEVLQRFTPETRQVYVTRTGAEVPAVPASYVELTEDSQLTHALQQQMARNLGASATHRIASGHLPMLSRPAELAAVLNDVADSV